MLTSSLPKQVHKSHIAVMVMLVLFSPLAIDLYLPALPVMAEALHVTTLKAQSSITLFLVAMGVGQLAAGPFADKYGRRKVAIVGVCLYAVSAGLAWIATSLDALLIARVIQGFGACATSVAAFATVRDVYGPQRSGQMISYLNGAICFIPALAPVLGAFLTQVFGWRSNFSFMAIFAFLILIFVMKGFAETNPKAEQKQRYFKLSRYLDVLKNPMFIYHASLCMMAMAVILAYVTSAPSVLMDKIGLSMNDFTVWFGVNAVFNIIAAFTAPKFMDKYGTYKTLQVGLLVLSLSGLLMLYLADVDTPLAFMLPIFGSSFGFAWVLGSAAGRALAPFGDKAGTAAALLGLFQMSGAGLVVGIIQMTGLTAQIQIALLMLLMIPMALILKSSTGRAWHNIMV